MNIGTFTKNEHGGFYGQILTAGLNLQNVVFEKMEKGPDYVLSASDGDNCFEIGAAWKKSGEFGDYLSVKLDSPVLAAPISATLALKATDSGHYALRWVRRKEKSEA